MAFFKFPRWSGKQEPEGDSVGPAKRSRTPQVESIEDMRRRAYHRLIGAAVLVVAGVVGFPLVFDTQPRPIPVDVAIDIPDRNQAAPLPAPKPKPAPVPATPPPPAPAAAPATNNGLAPGEEIVPSNPHNAAPASQPQARPESPKPAASPESRPEASKPAAKPEPKPAQSADGERAQALLENRAAPATPAASAGASGKGRFIVQVGAFAENATAHEARVRLERAGFKTYAQVANTPEGKRIRVRLGPFASRAEADKAVERAKSAGQTAAKVLLLEPGQ